MATEAQVIRWAEALMRIHLDAAWTFQFDHARTRAGQCNYSKKLITLSKHLLRAEDDEIYQVILHEVAHAMAGPKIGHGAKWQKIANELGYIGGRLHTGPLAQDIAPWRGVCPQGHELQRFRQPKAMSSCAKCSRTFNANYLIQWEKVAVEKS
ncbi:MAG: SprT-like domain-containing protein [Microbacteriaceae bacterium]